MEKGSNGDDHDATTNRQEPAAVAGAFQRGEPSAIRVVRRRVRKIVRFRGYRMQEDDRKDLEQEIVTQIWQAATQPSFDAGDRFWGFVEVVTARRCLDWLRSRASRNRETALYGDLPEPARGPLRSTLDREWAERANVALALLAKPCRDLIYLHFGLGKTYGELAATFGKSEGALRVQMHRCIARARQAAEPTPTGAARESEGRGR